MGKQKVKQTDTGRQTCSKQRSHMELGAGALAWALGLCDPYK